MASASTCSAEERVALVAGVTGIVGLSLAELLLSKGDGRPPWRLYGVARRPKPTWFHHHAATYMQCNLLDREETLATLGPLSHLITHLFFTTWTNRSSEEDNVEANAGMLRNCLDALMQADSALQHVCLQTGTKHYLGPFDVLMSSSLNMSSTTMRIFDEDVPRLPGPNFYYAQEDLVFEAAATRESSLRPLTWAVHRAPIILGVSPASLLQLPFFLAAYACICKHDKEGLPFSFTGTPQRWDGPLEAVDSRLIAEQEIWAATHPVAHNQAFNVSNGDGIRWRDIWPAIASFFGLQAPPYKGESQSLMQIMQGKAHVWERLVTEYKLLPTTWEQLVVGWWSIDFCTCYIPPYRLSTVKSAKLGFAGSVWSTEASLLDNFRTMQAMGLIPQQGS